MDRKSQILMSVLGVFALVIVTVGVSYAFFTYSRTGKQTNTIQSGKISFYYTETENGINLTNAMPVDTATATAVNSAAENSNVGYFTFDVGTVDLTGVEIDYTVYLDEVVLGEDQKALDRSMVSLQMTAASATSNNLGTATTADKLTWTTVNGVNSAAIATGTVKASGEKQSYALRMWLDSSNTNLEIHASDTNGDGVIVSGENYVVGSDDSTVTSTWGGATYSVKVRVTTGDVRTVNANTGA